MPSNLVLGSKFCMCGCGEIVRNQYVPGHNRRNAIQTEKSRQKMRQSHLGVPLSEKHRSSLSMVQKGMKKHWSEQGRKNIVETAKKRIGILHTEEHKKKISVAITGERNPFYNKHHTTETKQYLSQKHKDMELLMTEEEKRGRNSRLIPIRNNKYPRTPETHKKMSEVSKQRWREPEYVMKQMKARGVAPNKMENDFQLILDTMFPKEWKYVGDGQVIISGKCPDFINVNGQKKIIELFGDYWHEDKEVEERKAVFKPFGYETLVIWEHELENEIGNVISKLQDFAVAN